MISDNTLIKLSLNDMDWATTLLTEAFLNEPPIPHLFHEPHKKKQATYFMRCSCSYALLFGEGYTDRERNGVALWLLPNKTAMTPGKMYKAGMLSAPFTLGLSTFGRFMGFAGHTDKLHKQAAPMPHYYLFALGVKPSAQGKGVGGILIKSMLQQIDQEKMPTYLETQKENNVSLYQKFGFQLAAQGEFPKLKGLCNYGMLRKAAT
jgi:ribosomal protein S18 acetylase RimI-like enzyme